MAEVTLNRVAGAYNQDNFPLDEYVQSPIGLVPKSEGKTRLSFHLSYKFPNGNRSVNECTPDKYCSVKYNDLDHAIKNCSAFGSQVFWAKTDVQSAFWVVPILPKHRFLLVMKAKNPDTGKYQFFVDKNLPFGHSISCLLFQKLSNAVAHIV